MIRAVIVDSHTEPDGIERICEVGDERDALHSFNARDVINDHKRSKCTLWTSAIYLVAHCAMVKSSIIMIHDDNDGDGVDVDGANYDDDEKQTVSLSCTLCAFNHQMLFESFSIFCCSFTFPGCCSHRSINWFTNTTVALFAAAQM